MSRYNWKKKSLYIASLLSEEIDDYNNSITTYGEPLNLGLQNIQPLSGTTDITEYGAKVSKMQKVLLDYDTYLNMFKERDLAYIETTTPDGEKVNGENANYIITSVRNQNKKIAIYFEKLPRK